jgi:TonB family protein
MRWYIFDETTFRNQIDFFSVTLDTFRAAGPPNRVREAISSLPMLRAANFIVVVILSAGLFTGTGAAQTQGRQDRKVVDKVAPVYPDLAKRMHITGVVKLEVVVRANGNVRTTKVVGGNPVLIQSATDAVRKWKFETASEETTGVVELMFDPH